MSKKCAWKDVTAYSRNDKERKPNAWEIDDGFLRVAVTWNSHQFPRMWSLFCPVMKVDDSLPGIKEGDLEGAKKAALRVLAFRANRLMQSVATFQNA